MKHLLTALTTLTLAACTAPRDTLYHVEGDAPDVYQDAVAACLVEFQPLVPFELSYQRGGLVDERVSAYTRVVGVATLPTVPWDGRQALGRYSEMRELIEVTTDERLLESRERGQGRAWLVKRIVCHEIGHSLGLDHSDCGEGSLMHPMGAGRSANAPGECEAAVLREIHGE